MSTINTDVATLLEWGKRLDPDGKIAGIAEVLNQDNAFLDEMLFMQGNLPTGHQTSVRTGLPTVNFRLINQGVAKSKSTTAQITENAAILEARSEIDEDLASLNGNTTGFRLSEALPHMEAMSQKMAATVIYGSGANPEEFVGFANRYNDLSDTNSQNILDAGGTTGANSSVWLVNWGAQTVFGIFPKGSTAGLSHVDLGLGDAFDSNNRRFRAWMDQYKWKAGLVVKDWRHAVRIANIDISDLEDQANSQVETAATAIIKLMSRAIDRIPRSGGTRMSFYSNRTVLSLLRVTALDKSQNAVTIEPAINQFGNNIHQMRIYGVPIGVTDQLTEAEARVI